MTWNEMIFGTGAVAILSAICGCATLAFIERVRSILEKKRTDKFFEEEKKALRSDLEMYRARMLQDKREVCSFVYYDGGNEYEQKVVMRSAHNLKDYLHTMTDYLMQDLSDEELSDVENKTLELMKVVDDINFGYIVYYHMSSIRRMYGETILAKIESTAV